MDHHIHNSDELASKLRELKLNTDETMVSFDITPLFTSIPATDALTAIRRRLEEDSNLTTRSSLNPHQICLLLDLCLDLYQQRHSCAMGSFVSPPLNNLYIEQVEMNSTPS